MRGPSQRAVPRVQRAGPASAAQCAAAPSHGHLRVAHHALHLLVLGLQHAVDDAVLDCRKGWLSVCVCVSVWVQGGARGAGATRA